MEMNSFDKIDFVDDGRDFTPSGIKTVGKASDMRNLTENYEYIFVAIGNAEVRLSLIEKLKSEASFKLATLISPKAYISPSAKIMQGSVIEPMAVVHTGAVISEGCIISAGAVVNHAALCCEGVHVDCNATVAGNTSVPKGTKVECGEVFHSSSDK